MIPSFEALLVASYVVVPGFLATHSFNAVVVRETRDTTRMVIEWLAISMLFWIVAGPLLGGGLLACGWDLTALDVEARSTVTSQAKVNALLLLTTVAVLLPPLAGWGLGLAVRELELEDRLGIRPLHPRAWDELFSRREAAYLIATLKNGDRVGGYFGPRSFASSYPNPEDLYLEVVVPLDDDGNFAGSSDEHSAGVWIAGSEIRALELFTPLEPSDEQKEELERTERRLSADSDRKGLPSGGFDRADEAITAPERVSGEAVQHAEQQHQRQPQDKEVVHEQEEATY